MREPSPRRMNKGSPPTERNARTGLLTPPGRRCIARPIKRPERSMASTVLAFKLPSLPRNRFHPLSELVHVLYLHYPVKPVITLTRRPSGHSDAVPRLRKPPISLGGTLRTRACRSYFVAISPALVDLSKHQTDNGKQKMSKRVWRDDLETKVAAVR